MLKDCQRVLSCTKCKVCQDGVTEVSFTVVLVEFALVLSIASYSCKAECQHSLFSISSDRIKSFI